MTEIPPLKLAALRAITCGPLMLVPDVGWLPVNGGHMGEPFNTHTVQHYLIRQGYAAWTNSKQNVVKITDKGRMAAAQMFGDQEAA